MAKKKESAQSTVRRIRRKTRKKYSAEDKIRIVIEGLRGEMNVAELCRKEGIRRSTSCAGYVAFSLLPNYHVPA
jgi:transposase